MFEVELAACAIKVYFAVKVSVAKLIKRWTSNGTEQLVPKPAKFRNRKPHRLSFISANSDVIHTVCLFQ